MVWLNALKASPRSCAWNRSRKLARERQVRVIHAEHAEIEKVCGCRAIKVRIRDVACWDLNDAIPERVWIEIQQAVAWNYDLRSVGRRMGGHAVTDNAVILWKRRISNDIGAAEPSAGDLQGKSTRKCGDARHLPAAEQDTEYRVLVRKGFPFPKGDSAI